MKKFTLQALFLALLMIAAPGKVNASVTDRLAEAKEAAPGIDNSELLTGFTLTFTIYDGTSVVPGAFITCNGEAIQSDSSGVAVFHLVPTGLTSFLVNATGLVDYTSEVYVSGDMAIPVYMNKFHTIKFTITNGVNPLPGAAVVINDDTARADINGVALFDTIFPGYSTYTFTVTAAGYADSTANVTLESSNIIVDPIVLKKTYDVAFTVTDNLANPLIGAVVTINSEDISTDSQGVALFSEMFNGSYSFNVSMSGFVDHAGTLIINNANIDTTIVLVTGYKLTLNIFNGPSDTIPLGEDTVTVNSNTKVSDNTGVLTYGLVPGNYPFTVNRVGFHDTSFVAHIVSSDVSLNLHLIPSYTVLFNVSDGLSYLPVEGATVLFKGQSKLTDADGNVGFNAIAPSALKVLYQITASGGYFTDTASISLPFTSTTVNENNILSESVYLIRPAAGITLAQGLDTYLGEATLRIDTVDYAYDNAIGMSFLPLDTGMHSYVVTPLDPGFAIVSGNFHVGSSGSDFVTIQMLKVYKVDMFVVDSSSTPITGAMVVLDGDTMLTDVNGEAVFTRKLPNTYSFNITMAGYYPIPATNVTIDSSDVLLSVIMGHIGYSITFTVTDTLGNPMAGASVTITGPSKGKGVGMDDLFNIKPVDQNVEGGIEITQTTDSLGQTTFVGLLPGTYSYLIMKNGIRDTSGTFTIVDTNQTLYISTGIKMNLSDVKLPYPNPTVDLVNVSIPSGMNHAIVTVRSITGTQLIQKVQGNMEGTEISIDLHEYPAGIYLIQVSDGTSQKTWPVLKR